MSASARRSARQAAIGLFAIALVSGPGAAWANGRFPTANQLLVDPVDPSHLIIRATYGTLVSRDGGKTTSLVCEQAIGASGDADPMMGLFSSGALVAGVIDGVSITRDGGCSWSLLPGFAKNEYVVDVVVQKDDPSHGVVISSTGGADGGFVTVLFETTDGAASFHRLGAPLGDDFVALTVEAAPSDPARLYVSGLVSPAKVGDAQTPVIARSSDRGATWTRFGLPPSITGAGTSAWVSAVDPGDRDRVYARLSGPSRDHLLASSDGGATWDDAFTAAGQLTGFALSPDGAHVAIGGAMDGVQLAATSDLAFHQVSSVHAACLSWAKAGLYACGAEIDDHFTVGLSTDLGHTFAPLSHLAELCPLTCASGTTAAELCTDDVWRGTAQLLGVAGGACETAPLDGGATDGEAASIGATPRAVEGSCAAGAGGRNAAGAGVGVTALLALLLARRRPAAVARRGARPLPRGPAGRLTRGARPG